MGIMVYSLLWVMQDFVHQPYEEDLGLWATLDILTIRKPKEKCYPHHLLPILFLGVPNLLLIEERTPRTLF